jgi:ADP-ribose pyrophosphatase YjhB (NUDIX family)
MTELDRESASRAIVKGRRRVAANTMFDIFFDHLFEPPNREVAEFLVVQPRRMYQNKISGVCVLPVIGGKIALVSCYRHPIGEASLEAPKGFVDAGETANQAALRELKEETGLSCPPQNLIPLGLVAPEPGVINGRLALFAATGCSGTLGIDVEEFGLGAIHLLEPSEVDTKVNTGAIQDAVTLILYYKYRAQQQTGAIPA